MTIEQIARICHEANVALCAGHGDLSQLFWGAAPDWQRQSAINGVKFHLDNPNATPENSHENWLKEKEADGWKYGAVKNPEAKEHPCFVPYNELPAAQQAKDHLFRGIVHALAPFVEDFVSIPASRAMSNLIFDDSAFHHEILDHKIQDGIEWIDIFALDHPGAGEANHRYQIDVYRPQEAGEVVKNDHTRGYSVQINFQHGAFKDGANGILTSALLAILLDVHRGFAKGKFATRENSLLVTKLEECLDLQARRSRERSYRGVLGTYKK